MKSLTPRLIYGTAWKADSTRTCVAEALATGFRALDSANQPKHYHERAVGVALEESINSGLILRSHVFIQTKFTPVDGHDIRVPYDPRLPVMQQVRSSFASSLRQLGVDNVDAYILHGPSQPMSLSRSDFSAWRAMEELASVGRISIIGVSNFSPNQLRELLKAAIIPPTIVQNPCFANSGWDREMRAICRERDIMYQGFALLAGNTHVLNSCRVRAIASAHLKTPAQVVLRFSQQIGVVPVTGPASPAHMREGLGLDTFVLDERELVDIAGIGRFRARS